MKTIQQAQRHIGRRNKVGKSEMKNLDLSSQRHEFRIQNSECPENSVPLYLCASVPSSRSAFTLLEVMIAAALFGLVVAGTIEVYIMCNKLWHRTALNMQTVRESSLALSRMIYGTGTNNGLRAASMVTLATAGGGSWHISVSNLSGEVQCIYYNSPAKILSNANSIICNDVSAASITNNANGTIHMQLTVEKHDGSFISSNTVSTSVKMRNQP